VARTEIQCKEAGVIRGLRRSRGDSADFSSRASDLFTITTTKALRVKQAICLWLARKYAWGVQKNPDGAGSQTRVSGSQSRAGSSVEGTAFRGQESGKTLLYPHLAPMR